MSVGREQDVVGPEFAVDEGVAVAGPDLGGQNVDLLLQLPACGGGAGLARGGFGHGAQGPFGDALLAGIAVRGTAVVDDGDLPEPGARMAVQGGEQLGHPLHGFRGPLGVAGQGVLQAAAGQVLDDGRVRGQVRVRGVGVMEAGGCGHRRR